LVVVALGSLLAIACSSRSDLDAGAGGGRAANGGTGGAGGAGGTRGGTGTGDDCICDFQPPRDAGTGGAVGGATGGNGAMDATGLPVCQWPAALEPSDASAAGQCRAARAFVSCADANGGGVSCLSDDPTKCPDTPVQVGATFTCQNQCAADEYGAACGSVGPSTAPFPEAPAGCRQLAATPAGVVFYCCPCIAASP
jgi:hypothetical protein